ncbi:MAG: cysteine hydrolase [Zavarzinia sp.]|nr:cysteine hydrolase [Zavarzinia sp.]
MREFAGRRVFDRLEEIVDPDHTALLVVDMQNDFCAADGAFGKAGADTGRIRAAVPAIASLLDGARAAGLRRIFLRHTHEPDLSNLSPARLSFYAMLYGGADPYHALRGTWGQQIIDALAPIEGEAVVDKGRSSGFIGTNLDMLLRSNGIQSVVITGMATHACVESTARDAGFLDYYVVVARDAVADYRANLHEASLLTLGQRVVLADSAEILRPWGQTGETRHV